jgi:hypothetical protein
MMYDEIVVGSGLTALGVVLGFAPERQVLVIGGPEIGTFVYYGGSRTQACGYLGHGGLGSYWHGVIPIFDQHALRGAPVAAFDKLLRYFYPHTNIDGRFGEPWLFVPWRPIRPKAEWPRLSAERAGSVQCLDETVTRVVPGERDMAVHTRNATYRGQRVWLCAGALHTPALLERSLGARIARPFVSDHVFCYMGQIDRKRSAVEAPHAHRTRDGVWFESRYDDRGRALYMLRPARFAFSRLDHGFEQRSNSGPPAGQAAAEKLRTLSPGLLAEALYNRTGLFPNARVQSVYAQINVPDAHHFCSGDARLSARVDVIRCAVDAVREHLPWPTMNRSRRPDLFMPANHLHCSVDAEVLTRAGVNLPASRLQVADASVLHDIGPDHHSFKLMVAAYQRAQAASPFD